MSSVQQQQQQQQQPQRLPPMAEETKNSENGDLFVDSVRAAVVDLAEAPGGGKDLESGKGGGTSEGYAGISDHGIMTVFTFLKICTAISALYMMTNPWFFFYDAEKGEICPYTVICATSPLQLALLTGSRMSAGILYASLTISILSKCYATRAYVHRSWVGAVLNLEPSHDVHTYFGMLTLVAGFEHGILHCTRYIVANEAWIIYEKDTGRSGMVACLLLLPIVLPMKFAFFKKRLSFQFRKNLHMLFLPLLVALCFHSLHFRYVGSILLVWYILDRFYFTTNQTYVIDNPFFEAVGRGTMVGLDLPDGYEFQAGSFIYVNCPTISRSEWHPFSIIHVPGVTPKAAFYVEAVGDWTKKLFRLGLDSRLPLWITAAQPSLMERSIYYDNLVLVCTGAGITPGVSIIERFATKKNIHLIWITRDSGMVALFEYQVRQVKSTVHVTGKQKDEVKDALSNLLEPPKKEEVPTGDKSFGLSVLQGESFFSVGGPALPSRSRSDASGDEEHGLRLGPGTPKTPQHPQAGPAAVYPRRASVSNAAAMPPARQPMARRGSMLGLGRRNSTLGLGGRDTTALGNPVKVVFGRPDIAKYLAETVGNGSSSASTNVGSRGSFRDSSRHEEALEESQRRSKAVLMRADSMLKLSQKPPKSRKQKAQEASDGGDDSSRAGSSKPWLVLYCGANPKVEEAIATTCAKLDVQWKKEYFGAW